VGLSLLELSLRVLRYRAILAHFRHPVPLRSAAVAQLVGIFAGNLSPLRVGEPLKALVLERRHGTPLAAGVMAAVLERLLDLAAMSLLLLLAVVTVAPAIPVSAALAATLGLAFLAVYVLLLLALARGFLAALLRRLGRRSALLLRVASGLETLSGSGRSIAGASLAWAALSVLILAVDVGIVQVLLYSLGQAPHFLLTLAVIAVGTLGGIASQAPGGLGSTEAIVVFLFTQVGVSPAAGFAAIVLARGFGFYAFTAVGWLLATRQGIALGLHRGGKRGVVK